MRRPLRRVRIVRHHDDGFLVLLVQPLQQREHLARRFRVEIAGRLVGQEQRVAIARAIVTDPQLLLADEPTGDLDAKSAAEVLTLLQRLNQELKKTIVMVTHDPHAAERASHVLHLEKGTLVEQAQVG